MYFSVLLSLFSSIRCLIQKDADIMSEIMLPNNNNKTDTTKFELHTYLVDILYMPSDNRHTDT